MSYESSLIENYRAVRRRLYRAPVVPPVVAIPPVQQQPKPHVRDFLIITQDVITPPRWRVIADEVCVKHNVTLTQIKGAQRGQPVVRARHELFYRLSRETSMSLAGIGRMVGGKDHTSVMHGVQRHQERMAEA